MTAVPGTRLLAFASRWFEAPVVVRVFDPLVADWQREWIESAPSRRPWVRARGVAAFACAVSWSVPRVLSTPTPSGVMRRVTMKVLLFVGVVCALLSIPILRSAPTPDLAGVFLLITLPGMAAAALPFAMVAAVDAIRCHETLPNHVERAVAVKLALVAVAIVLLNVGWFSPASGRAWRAMTNGDTTSAGLREVSIVGLLTHPARQQDPRPFTISGTVRRELSNRGTMVLLPILLIWLRWRLLDLPRGRWVTPLPATVVAMLALTAFMMTRAAHYSLEATLALKPGTGMWMLMVIFPVWGMASHGWAKLVRA